MRLFGYARVSTYEQNIDLQLMALKKAGCSHIFSDKGISGAKFDRPGLLNVLEQLKAGDMLVVWRLDRLGRSLPELIALINELGKAGVEFRSLCEAIDTSSAGGRLLFHLLAAIAEFERALISDRTKAGLAAARARGKQIGRRPSMTALQIKEAKEALKHDHAIQSLADHYGIHQRTITRIIRQYDRGLYRCNDLSLNE